MASRRDPVVCTLGQTEVGGRLREWTDLAQAARSVDPIAEGVRLVFSADCGAAARDLAEREASCCPFLWIEVAHERKRY